MGSGSTVGRLYKIHEFAELAGVTVRTLHHYDRVGLLKPKRTAAGYRCYSDRDLERLEQIVALKTLGFLLKEIGTVLLRSTGLRDALRLQRQALEEKQMLLGRAIRAIAAAEESSKGGAATDPALLKKVIEVLAMQDGIEAMKKYYTTEQSWEKRRRYYEEGPSPEWQTLYRDVSAARGRDPGSDECQALGERWLQISKRAASGDVALQLDSPTAWMDREHWPPFMKQRLAEFNLEAVYEFIGEVAAAARKKYSSEEAWARMTELRKHRAELDLSDVWQARVELFLAIEKAIRENASDQAAQALVDRWSGQLEEASAGDPEVREGLMRAWEDRRNWAPMLRHQMEGMYLMDHAQFLKCADFVDEARRRRVT